MEVFSSLLVVQVRISSSSFEVEVFPCVFLPLSTPSFKQEIQPKLDNSTTTVEIKWFCHISTPLATAVSDRFV